MRKVRGVITKVTEQMDGDTPMLWLDGPNIIIAKEGAPNVYRGMPILCFFNDDDHIVAPVKITSLDESVVIMESQILHG